jgi:hypothetical protein
MLGKLGWRRHRQIISDYLIPRRNTIMRRQAKMSAQAAGTRQVSFNAASLEIRTVPAGSLSTWTTSMVRGLWTPRRDGSPVISTIRQAPNLRGSYALAGSDSGGKNKQPFRSQRYDTTGLNTLDLAATGNPDNRLNKIVTGCPTGECLELLLRQIVAH